MTETREICLDVNETEATLLAMALRYVAKEKPVRNEELYVLVEKIELAWMEAEFRDEADAHNDCARR